jgi:hypothetical protein
MRLLPQHICTQDRPWQMLLLLLLLLLGLLPLRPQLLPIR